MGSEEEDEEDGTEGFGADQAVENDDGEEEEEAEEEAEEEDEEDEDSESDVGYPRRRRCFAVQTNAVLVGCCLTHVLVFLWCTILCRTSSPSRPWINHGDLGALMRPVLLVLHYLS